MIEARNFYWKEVTEGEPRSTYEEKREKHKLCRFHPLLHLWNIPACTCWVRPTLLSTPGCSIQYKAEIDKKTSHYNILWSYLGGWDREGGREMQEGGDMGIYVYV